MYKFNWDSARVFYVRPAVKLCVNFFYANNFTLKALDKKPHRKNYGLRRLLRTA
jgi:hypothetical protein